MRVHLEMYPHLLGILKSTTIPVHGIFFRRAQPPEISSGVPSSLQVFSRSWLRARQNGKSRAHLQAEEQMPSAGHSHLSAALPPSVVITTPETLCEINNSHHDGKSYWNKVPLLLRKGHTSQAHAWDIHGSAGWQSLHAVFPR